MLVAVAYVLAPILAAVIMNIAIYKTRLGRNMNKQGSYRSPLLPPGWVIATIWSILFGLLGYIMYLNRSSVPILVTVAALLIYCLLYPVYTNGLDAKFKLTKLANTMSLVFAFTTALVITMYSKESKQITTYSILLIVPLLLWTTYVNIVDALTKQ